jgi:hypothetical protein
MSMSWENGLYICDGCQGEFASYELTEVIGGIDTDYCEVEPGHYVEWMTGKRIEMTREQFEKSYIYYGIWLCETCQKKRDDETAAKLLSQ